MDAFILIKQIIIIVKKFKSVQKKIVFFEV